MKLFANRRIWLCAVLGAAVLAFFAWIYGWGGGPIQLLDFPAEDVEYIRLSDTLRAVEVRSPEDIQALMDAVNSFRHSGNQIKNHPFLLFGFAVGGTELYTFHVFLKNGEEVTLHFGSNQGGQDPADTEVSYWVEGQPSSRFGDTCRGSMELIYELMKQAQPVGVPSW